MSKTTSATIEPAASVDPIAPFQADLDAMVKLSTETSERVDALERQLSELSQCRGDLAVDVQLGRAKQADLDALKAKIAALDAERLAGLDVLRACKRRQTQLTADLEEADKRKLRAQLDDLENVAKKHRLRVQAAIDALVEPIAELTHAEKAVYAARIALGLPARWRGRENIVRYLESALGPELAPFIGHVRPVHRLPLEPEERTERKTA